MEQRVLNKRQLNKHANDINGNGIQIPETIALMRIAKRRNIDRAFRNNVVIGQADGAPGNEKGQQE